MSDLPTLVAGDLVFIPSSINQFTLLISLIVNIGIFTTYAKKQKTSKINSDFSFLATT